MTLLQPEAPFRRGPGQVFTAELPGAAQDAERQRKQLRRWAGFAVPAERVTHLELGVQCSWVDLLNNWLILFMFTGQPVGAPVLTHPNGAVWGAVFGAPSALGRWSCVSSGAPAVADMRTRRNSWCPTTSRCAASCSLDGLGCNSVVTGKGLA